MEAIAAKNVGASPTDLKARVLAVRSRLPKDIRTLVLDKYPEYDTAQGSRKLNNVLAYASSDERLTQILEALATTVPA
ncbi:MAG: hypothetical protein ACRYFX_29190 [Janthinobacterium lividum]